MAVGATTAPRTAAGLERTCESGPSAKAPQADFHAAVRARDASSIERLRALGQRPVQLDEQGRTPANLLAEEMDPAHLETNTLRQALQGSRNPTAPRGYIKPDAFHGSPWGLEILASGALRGGVNDIKGGAESLEGKVFFSDRTAEHAGDTMTRPDVRRKARTYADGKGTKPSSASNRARQYRMLQALESSVVEGKPLRLTQRPVRVEVGKAADVHAAIKTKLQSVLTDKGFVLSKLTHMPLDEVSRKVDLPAQMTIAVKESGSSETLAGAPLHDLYVRLIGELKCELEGGKAPLLSLINNGTVVPVVFGFDKISGLQQHAISGAGSEAPKLYSYQDQSHPLAGAANGGKLQEIEVRNLKDLATLMLACSARGIALPADVVVRVNPPANLKKSAGLRAQYLTADQVQGFKSHLDREITEIANLGEGQAAGLSDASIEALQGINAHLRNVALERLLPKGHGQALSH